MFDQRVGPGVIAMLASSPVRIGRNWPSWGEAKRRIRLLEAQSEVLRRAAAYLSQANLPGK